MSTILNLIFWVVFSLCLYKYVSKTEKDINMCKLLLFIIFARLVFANLKYFLGLPPNFPDAGFYRESIESIVNGGLNFSVFKDRIDVMSYVWFYSIIQYISGNIYITIINLNSIFGSLAIYNAGRIAKEINGKYAQGISMILLLIYPSLLVYTNDNLREGPVLFFITMAMFKIVQYIKYNNKTNLIEYLGLLIPIFLLRVVNMPIMVMIGVISVIIVNRNKVNKKYLAVISIISILVVIGIVYKYTSIRLNLDYINQVLNRDRLDTSAYLVGVRYDSWFELVLYTPIRLFYLLFHPFPWVVSSYKHLTTTISSLFEFIMFVTMIILAVKNLNKVKFKDLFIIFIIFIMGALTIYAVVKTEAAARHRLQFVWGIVTCSGILISTLYDEKLKNKLLNLISKVYKKS